MEITPKGYNTYEGYVGYINSNETMLFASESDYIDYISDENKED